MKLNENICFQHIFIFTYLCLLSSVVLAFLISIVYGRATRLINFQNTSTSTWKEIFYLFTPEMFSFQVVFMNIKIIETQKSLNGCWKGERGRR